MASGFFMTVGAGAPGFQWHYSPRNTRDIHDYSEFPLWMPGP